MAQPLHLRTAQFVTTYGPGALLEGRLSRVIPRPDCGGLENWQKTVEAYEVDPGPLATVLAHAGRTPRLFRVPSNAALGRSEEAYVYRTRAFPRWRLCWNRPAHAGRHVILYPGRACPICRSENPDDLEAVRFVLACPAGHLDEVPWEQVAHDPAPRCPKDPQRSSDLSRELPYYFWQGGGGSLRELRVQCPRCGQSGSLGRAFHKEWTCRGRFPELEQAEAVRPGGCTAPAQIMQRGAAALRVADILTAFRIRIDALQSLLERPSIRRAFEYVLIGRPDGSLSPDILAAVTDRLLRDQELTSAEADAVRAAGPDRVSRLVRPILQAQPAARTLADVIRGEFEALLALSQPEAPPQNREATPQFAGTQAREIPWPGAGASGTIRVVPAVRLESLMVQHAYRRVVRTRPPMPPEPVDIGIPAEDGVWYPAIELEGEGLFLTGSPALVDAAGWAAAERAAARHYAAKEFLFRGGSLDRPDELAPVFVWWHTLAHALIRVLAVEAGYEMSGIRERVYVRQDGGHPTGGIMLYAVLPGSSGSLGGLLALAPHLPELVQRARELVTTCSNDPLCGAHRFHPGGYCGAACHACLFLPETSCEHRNMWLDRRVLAELPW